MQRRRFNQWLGGLSASALAVPALQAQAQARPLLKAGDQKGGLQALLEAAGELKGLAYDIQWTEFPAAAPLAEALNAQAVDLGPIGDAPLIFTLAAGSRVKAFAVNRSDAYGTAVLVAPNSPLKSAKDLKGKSVATNRGSIGHFVTLKALASVGLKAEDVQLRFLPPADAKLALTQGSVDAWATWEPYTALAETGGHARVLVSGRGLWSGLSYLAATDTALRDKRSVLQDFAQRAARAQQWARQHPTEFGGTLARIIGIPVEAAKLQFERRQTRWQAIDAEVIAEQQRTADFYLDAGLIKQRLDVRATFDTGFSAPA
ncbi:ABC transporter substrate-binding protein [Curvibacter sp. RS43]|uniref:ABC transporter substrate-binding protein n=1 Tax=Curvibacter cyanobacteriorum TaxID=3026422 RepID=A0ABT5N0J3_9BURK|nr:MULTISPECIES: ABC transporter substrate-binding protein [unclassified Curvibacter]MDD0812465.1 ABC transporter substrate-binding protein [Curvibacter sp. RS43]MDD0839834.1 ABC transporter substrate-binding protein [Curvibacter sp. HBC61]